MREVLLANSDPTRLNSLKIAIEDGLEFHTELILTTKRSNLKWVNVSSSPFRNASGEIIGAVLLVVDISLQKLAEKKIERSENEYRTLFDAMNAAIIVANAQGEITFVSPQLLGMTGYSEEDLIGKTGDLLLPEATKYMASENMKRREQGEYSVYEIEIQKKDGELLWVNVSAGPIKTETGQFNGSLSVLSDITKPKKDDLREEVVYRIAQQASDTNIKLQDFFQTIYEELMKVLDAENLYICLYDAEKDELSFPFVVDSDLEEVKKTKAYDDRPMSEGLTERVIRSRKSVLLNHQKMEEVVRNYDEYGKKPASWLGVPLFEGEKVMGALVVQSYMTANRFNESDQEFLEYASRQISSTLLRIRSHHNLVASRNELIEERTKTLKHQSKLLSTQLNPHFIFNSLNSIQYYILENADEPALEFLSKFSSLMRAVLHNSDQLRISLKEEVDFLRLYLDLEMGRHINKFDYEIVELEPLDMNEIMIPPMLLQPYIENSIIHGVGYLTEGGHIQISFEQHGDFVHCHIVDNGVGRAKASELKVMREGIEEYKSKSTQIIKDRISILKEIDQMDYDNKIEDLFDDDGNPVGTKVTVIFPYQT